LKFFNAVNTNFIIKAIYKYNRTIKGKETNVLGRTHIALGLVANAILINTNDTKSAIVAVGITAFSSVLPDIDHPNGLLRRITGITSKPLNIIICLGIFFWLIYKYQLSSSGGVILTGAAIAALFTPHRTFTHSLFGFAAYSLGVYFLYRPFFYPFAIGYLMHLIADYFTTSGMQLYYPFGEYEKFGLVTTGSIEDDIIGMIAMIIFLIVAHFKLT
jgi:inner membrane protein